MVADPNGARIWLLQWRAAMIDDVDLALITRVVKISGIRGSAIRAAGQTHLGCFVVSYRVLDQHNENPNRLNKSSKTLFVS